MLLVLFLIGTPVSLQRILAFATLYNRHPRISKPLQSCHYSRAALHALAAPLPARVHSQTIAGVGPRTKHKCAGGIRALRRKASGLATKDFANTIIRQNRSFEEMLRYSDAEPSLAVIQQPLKAGEELIFDISCAQTCD